MAPARGEKSSSAREDLMEPSAVAQQATRNVTVVRVDVTIDFVTQ
jgi:hypothetical protein